MHKHACARAALIVHLHAPVEPAVADVAARALDARALRRVERQVILGEHQRLDRACATRLRGVCAGHACAWVRAAVVVIHACSLYTQHAGWSAAMHDALAAHSPCQ